MHSYVRPMQREDIVKVAEIDREAFPTEWPPPNFGRELQNRLAHYIIACDADHTIDSKEPVTIPGKGFTHMVDVVLHRFGYRKNSNKSSPALPVGYITGYAGYWIMADEAHIISIASRKEYRRQGIGELLLLTVMERAMKQKASIVTLEVRASNTTAQKLYYKCGFSTVGMRKGYYTDNREDAFLMSTDYTGSSSFKELLKQLKQAYADKWSYSWVKGMPHY